ncbi:hypothetical protein ACTFIT_001787 [Dictyostelium discoideum]
MHLKCAFFFAVPLKVLEDSFSKINVLNNNLPNEANPCFHTFKNEKLKHECLKLLDGNVTAPTLINQLRKELGLLTIPQHVVQKSVTCNPSLNVAGQLVPSIEHISNIHPLANALQLPPTSNTSKSFVHTLNPPDIVSQTLSNPPTIVTQAPSYTPTIVTQAPSNPPAIVTQTPSNLQEIVTQTLSNHPDNVIVPMLSPIKIQNNKQIIPRSPKHNSPQKPKKKLKFSRKELLANDFKILNRSIQGVVGNFP